MLNTFLEGLAELGVDKPLIKNKKILSDLLEKEKEYRNNKGFETTEEQSTDSEEDEVTASEKSHSQETENSDHEAESEIEDSDSESVQSYSKRIQIRVNTVKAQMFTLRS